MFQDSRLLRLAVACAAFASCSLALAQGPAPAGDPLAKQQQERQLVQPGNNEPVWTEVRSGAENFSSIKGPETGVLIQPSARFPGQGRFSTAGEAWRQFRNGPITVYGGWLILACCAIIAAIYFVLGPIKLHEKPTGRLLPRFSTGDRWAHWVMGISFCVLAVTGLVLLFGKHVLLPVVGYTLFSWLSALSKNLHNFVAPLFIVSLLAFIVMYLKDNLPEKGDGAWLATSWRFFTGGEQPPSGRFNAGEKVWFWVGVVAMCLIVSVSGVILLFPNFEQLRSTMQQAHVVHAVTALLVIGYALAHIYMGTIGVEGAYENMRDGVTDEAWAKEHHGNWYNQVRDQAIDAAGRSAGGAVPAGAPQFKQD
jgi:formate dehydrogenase subunit gamma